MASSTPICGICDLRHITKPSVVWCSECDEGLCDDCREHHCLSRGTRKHGTIPIVDYITLPSNVLKIKEYCSEHDERFEIFCTKHDCPCCRKCVLSEHKKCENIIEIESVTKNVKSSDTFLETKQLLAEILTNIGQIRQDRENNSKSIADQQKKVIDEIRQARQKLNSHLDKLQERLLVELAEVAEKATEQMSEIQASLDENEKRLFGFQDNMVSIKQYASDLQTFLSLRKIERDVATIDTSIMSLSTNDIMRSTIIKCEIDTSVKNCSADIPKFGKIVSTSQPSELKILRKKNKQAQIMTVTSPPITVENVSLELQQAITTELSKTRGCIIVPDGRMLISSFGTLLYRKIQSPGKGRVRSFNKDGSQGFDTGVLPVNAYDIAYIENTNTIAVTTGGYDQCIVFTDAQSGETKKTTRLNSYCYGLVNRNNELIFCASSNGIRVMDLSNNSVRCLVARNMPANCYIASFGDKLYFTECNANTVTCCDLTGKTQWEFKDENILRCPYGITVDSEGNVYVVGHDSSNVVFISSDGKRHKQLLSESDGLCEPRVLHFERSMNQLLVANAEYSAFLFTVRTNT